MKLRMSKVTADSMLVAYILIFVLTLATIQERKLGVNGLSNKAVYIYNYVTDMQEIKSSDDNIILAYDDIEYAEFVLVEAGYSFNEMDEFEYYGTYESPVILASKNRIIGELDYKEVIDASINKTGYEDIGIKSVNLTGEVECSIYGNHADREMIQGLLNRELGSNAINLEANKETGLYFQFAYIDNGAQEVKSNIPHASLLIDIYKRSNSSKELNGIVGFTRVDESKLGGIINIKELATDIETGQAEDIVNNLNNYILIIVYVIFYLPLIGITSIIAIHLVLPLLDMLVLNLAGVPLHGILNRIKDEVEDNFESRVGDNADNKPGKRLK